MHKGTLLGLLALASLTLLRPAEQAVGWDMTGQADPVIGTELTPVFSAVINPPGQHIWTTEGDFAAGVLTNTVVVSGSVMLSQTVAGYAAEGSYLSAVADAGGLVRWATLVYTASIPDATAITLSVRAGNTATPDRHWIDWHPLAASPESLGALPPSRYFQWKAEFASTLSTTTPSLEELRLDWDGFSYTSVGGNLMAPTTWHAANSPYLVTSNLVVYEGITLTVEPGVTVWMSDTRALQVWGGLVALGTPAEPITFTSWQAYGQREDWGGLAFFNTAVSATVDAAGNYLGGSALRYTTVQYAGAGSFDFAVDAAATTLYVDHCTIQHNQGGLKIGGTGSWLSANTIVSNTAPYVTFNSGIYNVGQSTTLRDNVIRYNQSGYYGGGLHSTGGDLRLVHNLIADNDGFSYGGGLYLDGGSGIIEDNQIVRNTAGIGGGIHNYGASLIIRNNLIEANSAAGGGGGIYSQLGGGGNVIVSGNVISGNTNAHTDPYNYNGGGGLAFGAGGGAILYNTFVNNSSADGRSGIELGSCVPVHYNTFQGNVGFALYNSSAYCTGRVDARYNWWNAADEAGVDAQLYDWFDDPNRGVVDYRPFLLDRPDLKPTGIVLNGPEAGSVSVDQRFEAGIVPLAAQPPFTFTWQAEGQLPVIHTGSTLYDTATFAWNMPGVYSVTVAAANSQGVVTFTQAVSVTSSSAPDAFEVDDSCAQASTLTADGQPQWHTFDSLVDEDWAQVAVVSGTTYVIEALTPADSAADVQLDLYEACGGSALDGQNNSFSPDISLSVIAQHSGSWYLRLTNLAGLPPADRSAAYRLSVRALPVTPAGGAVILVAGKNKANDPLQTNIYSVTNAVYAMFLANGYTADRIQYLAPTFVTGVDALAGTSSLQQAITEWAPNYVDADHALTIYLMDHGDYDAFSLNFVNNQPETLGPAALDLWLDILEAARPGVKVNLILEACHSGSFIDLAQTVSQPGRVVVASTGAYPLAYASPTGAAFSDAFVAALGRGLSVLASFEEAQWAVTAAHPDQTPWLDDNGNGVPNEPADGQEAMRRGFAFAGTFGDTGWPPYLTLARFDARQGTVTAAVSVPPGRAVAHVWALLYPPSYQPPTTGEDMVVEAVPQIQLTDPEGDGLYSGTYAFPEAGAYRVVVYARDTQGLSARPRQADPARTVLAPVILR